MMQKVTKELSEKIFNVLLGFCWTFKREPLMMYEGNSKYEVPVNLEEFYCYFALRITERYFSSKRSKTPFVG